MYSEGWLRSGVVSRCDPRCDLSDTTQASLTTNGPIDCVVARDGDRETQRDTDTTETPQGYKDLALIGFSRRRGHLWSVVTTSNAGTFQSSLSLLSPS